MKNSNLKIQNLKIKVLVVFGIAALIFMLLPAISEAYKIYLKNGSVIKRVSYYEKSEGEIKFFFEGGAIGIPEADVLKIEGGAEPLDDNEKPAIKEATPEPEITRETITTEKPPQGPPQPSESDRIKEKITQKEAELKKLEGELMWTKVRLQNLFLRSSKGAITAEERSMLQQNMAKRNKLESDKKTLEEELKTLYAEKQRLGG